MEKDLKNIQLPCPAEKLLMHRPPMLLIDTLIEREGDRAKAIARFDVEGVCHSGDRGVLQEYFLEIIAQTMAAANGFDGLRENSPPRDGFIVGVDAFLLEKVPVEKTEFTVAIVKNMEFGSMKIMEGEVFAGDTFIAKAELKVWEQEQNEG